MVHVVILTANGDFKVGKVGTKPSAAAVSKALRKTKIPDYEGSYTWKDTTISIWGWKEGKAGTENKHELPPPHDNILLFGDIIAATPKGDFTIEDWKTFYNAAFKGFEDIGSEDSESECDEEEEEDFEEEENVEEANEDTDESEGEGDDVEEEGDADGSATDDEEAEEEEADDECYDSDEGAGGGRRRTQRRRTTSAPEYRRMDMGLRSRIKIPNQVGKRAPRWQTAPELEPEAY